MRHTDIGNPGGSPSSLPRSHRDIGLHPAQHTQVPRAWLHPPLLQLISYCEEDLLRTLLYQDSGTSSAHPRLAPNSSVTPEAQERQLSTETGTFSLLPLPVSQSCALQFHLYPSQPLSPGCRTVVLRSPAWPGPAAAPQGRVWPQHQRAHAVLAAPRLHSDFPKASASRCGAGRSLGMQQAALFFLFFHWEIREFGRVHIWRCWRQWSQLTQAGLQGHTALLGTGLDSFSFSTSLSQPSF